ncbi:hypothetical protein JOM56_014836 [Amanita muscaria]
MSPNRLDHRAAAATRFGNSSERPEQFPVAILWTFADAKKDAAVGITLTNPNRPNLKQIIRTPGGSVADDSIYLTLRSSAHNSYFKDQWMAALEHLEELQPLLALCAEHWKAEAVLQSVLTSLHPKKGNNSPLVDDLNESSEEEAGNGQLEAKRPCLSPSVSRSPKRSRGMSVTRPAAGSTSMLQLLNSPCPSNTGGADLGAAIEKDTAGTMDPRAGADLTDNVDDNIKFNGPIDITFIKVTPTTDNLQSILAKRYPSYTAAIDLVKSLDLDSTVGRSIIAESVELFIRGVELADPRLQEYEEDDVGVSWGHYQLRGWREILPNWQAIGSPENARRLIAAVLKTCRVARALCHDLEMSERKIGSQTISYLSDNYLEQITEWLWELWKQAGGVSIPA